MYVCLYVCLHRRSIPWDQTVAPQGISLFSILMTGRMPTRRDPQINMGVRPKRFTNEWIVRQSIGFAIIEDGNRIASHLPLTIAIIALERPKVSGDGVSSRSGWRFAFFQMMRVTIHHISDMLDNTVIYFLMDDGWCSCMSIGCVKRITKAPGETIFVTKWLLPTKLNLNGNHVRQFQLLL